MPFSKAFTGDLLEGALGVSAYTPPDQTFLALHTYGPYSETDLTEFNGGSYSRQPVTWVQGTVEGSVIGNGDDITFTNMVDLPVTGFGIYDAVSGGNLLFWSLLNQPFTPTAGENLIADSEELFATLQSNAL